MARQTERGAALLMVLWLICLFALLVVAAGNLGWKEAQAARHDLDGVQTKQLTLAAAAYAGRILSQNQKGYDGPLDLRRAEISAEEPAELSDGTLCLRIEDEAGKININHASRSELIRLPGITDECAAAIIDWRVSGPFGSVEELWLVRGITEEIYSAIQPLVTVYGSKQVNFNTATSAAFFALGLGKRLAESVVQRRKGPAKNDADIEAFLFEAANTDQERSDIRKLLAGKRLGVGSTAFTVHLDILNERKSKTVKIEAVIAAEPGRKKWDIKKFAKIY